MKKFLFIILFSQLAFAVNHLPFPQAGNVPYSGIKPNNKTQQELNSDVTNFYNNWISQYLMESTTVPGDYKVNYDTTGATVSEAMGYGMLFTVYMAGIDTNAQKYFDGLNRFRKRYPSSINPNFMEWKIYPDEVSKNDDCAIDGDIDIATSLLLAYKQWEETNYYVEATNIIKNIEKFLVRLDFSLRLGDWDSSDNKTRPSDFITAHFRSFYYATGNPIWTNVENKCYSILKQLQTDYSIDTGLIPDFAIKDGVEWKPAPPNFLEGANDGHYYYNSCRVPWRISTSALYYNESGASNVIYKLMNWIYNKCNSPTDFRAGYKLNGDNINGNNYDTAAFISPTGIAATIITNQQWLNNTFSYAAGSDEAYFEDSINLFSLITMSGNLWLWDIGDIPEPSLFYVLILGTIYYKKNFTIKT